MRVAIQGEVNSFHHMAANEWFNGAADIVPVTTFSDVFEQLVHNNADVAIVAVENSIFGSINEVYSLIDAHDYPIVGEIHLRVHQQLIGLASSELKSIKTIYSHPIALAQCRDFIHSNLPDATQIEYYDTAASVEYIKSVGDTTYAAIASKAAADYHSLPVIASNIEDYESNYTRFLVVQPGAGIPKGANRSSISLTTDHKPGALAKILTHFAEARINIAKLQSQPIINQPLRYKFFLVLDTSNSELEAVIDKIRSDGNTVRVLGQYVTTSSSVLSRH